MAGYDDEQSRALADFDSASDDIRAFADRLEVLIDGARAGYLTELGKIALIPKHCTDPEVLALVASWRHNGILGEDGGVTAWRHCT